MPKTKNEGMRGETILDTQHAETLMEISLGNEKGKEHRLRTNGFGRRHRRNQDGLQFGEAMIDAPFRSLTDSTRPRGRFLSFHRSLGLSRTLALLVQRGCVNRGNSKDECERQQAVDKNPNHGNYP